MWMYCRSAFLPAAGQEERGHRSECEKSPCGRRGGNIVHQKELSRISHSVLNEGGLTRIRLRLSIYFLPFRGTSAQKAAWRELCRTAARVVSDIYDGQPGVAESSERIVQRGDFSAKNVPDHLPLRVAVEVAIRAPVFAKPAFCVRQLRDLPAGPLSRQDPASPPADYSYL